MEAIDSLLMQRFLGRGDSEALATIMDRYADMVYSTCRRVLGDESQAADVVQETFFQFVQHAHRITGSLGSWLHQVATRRAVDLVRQNASRRRREEAYAAGVSREPDTWEAVEPQVDEALEDMPHELREVLVRHYLQRQSMTEIAEANGVSQSTISRRIAAGLELLREKLRARDVVVGAGALGAMLAASAQAAPAPVLHGLGKVVLAAAASDALPETAATTAPVLGTLVKAAMAAAVIVAVVAGGMALFPQADRVRRAKPAQPAHAVATPAVANQQDAGDDTNASASPAQSISVVSSQPALPGPLPATSTPGIGPFGAWLPGTAGQALSGGTASFGSGGGTYAGARFGGGGSVGGFGGGGGSAGGGGGAVVVPGQPPSFAGGTGTAQRATPPPVPWHRLASFRAQGGSGGGMMGGGGLGGGGYGGGGHLVNGKWVLAPPAPAYYSFRRSISFTNGTRGYSISTYSTGVVQNATHPPFDP